MLLPVKGTTCNAFLIADRLPNGTVDLILAYCHNSLNDNSLQEWVPYLKEQGVAIISASPMSMGLMTTKVCFMFLHTHILSALMKSRHCHAVYPLYVPP